MDRTLFTPPMIDTFRLCRRAYKMAFETEPEKKRTKASVILKRFLLKGVGEINKGRITSVSQVQKFMGHQWPGDEFKGEEAVKAFLYAYKVLTTYVAKPYRPDGSRVISVGLKVRARVPHDRVYLEDSFDLILWHQKEKRLEFVDYHLHPLKSLDPSWPSASMLVKQFLAERLRIRWPFEKLSLTFCRIQPQGFTTSTVDLEETTYRAHWPEMLKTLNEMKDPESFKPTRNPFCKSCDFLTECMAMGQTEPIPIKKCSPLAKAQ